MRIFYLRKIKETVLLCTLLYSGALTAQTKSYDILPVNGNYSFAYNQVPENLVSLNPALSGFTYRWQSSTMPLSGFIDIFGATSATYVFPGALSQTTYFRRIATFSSQTFYSNVVKINVISKNWEDINYVREHDILVPGQNTWQAIDQLPIGSKLQTTTYLDGIGRPIQKVSRETALQDPAQPGNLWGDVVQFSKFDPFGRQDRQYLPYTTTTQSGKYKTTAETEQAQYYTSKYNETAPYSRVSVYDNSPLNRELTVNQAGTSWTNSNGEKIALDFNNAADNVQLFTIGYNSGDLPVTSGIYNNRALYKTEYTDENLKKVIEYTDKNGKLVLKKIELDDTHPDAYTGWICTYNIYDDFDQLRFVIQPEGVKWLAEHNWDFAATNGQAVADEWCFRYQYDDKGRTLVKKAPGAKELLMLYDQRDRVVFAQDGNQRLLSPPQWTANLYDELDRPVIAALYNTAKTSSALQTDIDNSVTVRNVTTTIPSNPITDLIVNRRIGGITAYTATNNIELVADAESGFESFTNDDFLVELDPATASLPVTVSVATYTNPVSDNDLGNPAVATVLKYLFYDNYSYPTAKPFNTSFDNAEAYSTGGDAIVKTQRTTNMLTGTMVRVLGTTSFLTSTQYYDEKGRPVQSLEDNIKSGVDISTSQYQFDGRLLSEAVRHTTAGSGYNNFSIITKYIYDKIGRVSSIQKNIGLTGFKPIATYDMDDMGRLKTKHLDPGYTNPTTGKAEMEALNYTYNIHSQITGINKNYALKAAGYNKWNNYFGLCLGFDKWEGVFDNTRKDGLVTGIIWNTQGDDAQRKYDFTYDNAGRLTNAFFKERQSAAGAWINDKMDFTVSGYNGKIDYDLNGNILAMLQKGVVPGSNTPFTVDDLRYTYKSYSNKLIKVADQGNLGLKNGKLGDFADGANTGDDYVYDDNGNLIIDLNKNASNVSGGITTALGVSGIKYNFLDKPEEIKITGKGIIKFLYDADGNRLQKSYMKEGATATTVTTYINEFVYEQTATASGGGNLNLQYINFEEGRLRVMQNVSQDNGVDYLTINGSMAMPEGKHAAWDFFVRDYQGNVRMILTEEMHTGSNSCTMEQNRAANEEPVFGKLDANGTLAGDNEVKLRFPISSIPGQTSHTAWTNNYSSYVSRIGNLAQKKIGPNVLMKVMAGDEISAKTMYYYKDPVTNESGGSSFLPDLVTGLVNTLSAGTAGALLKDNAAAVGTQLTGNVPFSSIAEPDYNNAAGNIPKAYLSVIFFDERFNIVEEGSIAKRVEQPGANAPDLTVLAQKAPKNGYCYVYVSNESDEMLYFDNLQVTQDHARIIEENHYYAYGLKIAAISSRKLPDVAEGKIENKNLYGDQELDNEADLNWYDYEFRSYDPQIGRFVQIDPWSDIYDDLTPYHYAGLDPISNIDIDGLGIGDMVNLAEVVIRSSVKTSTHLGASITAKIVQLSAKITITVTAAAVETMADNATTSISVSNTSDGGDDPPGLLEQLGIATVKSAQQVVVSLGGVLNGSLNSATGGRWPKYPFGSDCFTSDLKELYDRSFELGGMANTAACFTNVNRFGGGGNLSFQPIRGGTMPVTLPKLTYTPVSTEYSRPLILQATAKKGGTLPNKLGKKGEKATKSDNPKLKVRYRGASGKRRIADKMTEKTLEETKNVAYQYWSTQLKDAAAFAKLMGKEFILHVRKSTKLSKELQRQRDLGNVKIEYIPGSK